MNKDSSRLKNQPLCLVGLQKGGFRDLIDDKIKGNQLIIVLIDTPLNRNYNFLEKLYFSKIKINSLQASDRRARDRYLSYF